MKTEVDSEPVGQHGPRSQFIKDVSEQLIMRVNAEASNIDAAKALMHQYMVEFCEEYDRCGYSLNSKSKGGSASSTLKPSTSSFQGRSDNLQHSSKSSFTDSISKGAH